MARIDVVMPQMGESIAEGTMSRWLKKVGDTVKRDEPLFEISTDKVDAEIPSPSAGILVEVLVTDGQTVAVQTVVARLETDASAAARNAGLAAATADIVVFLDADDQLLVGALSVFLNAHKSGQCSIVRTGALLGQAPGQPVFAEESMYPYPRGAPLAGTFSILRSLLNEAHGYDEQFRFGENSELLFRLMAEAGAAAVSYVRVPTVRIFPRSGRRPNHYDKARLDCINLMLNNHKDALVNDRETIAHFHAIASVLYRKIGLRNNAVEHAISALKYKPLSWRNWLRVLRSVWMLHSRTIPSSNAHL